MSAAEHLVLLGSVCEQAGDRVVIVERSGRHSGKVSRAAADQCVGLLRGLARTPTRSTNLLLVEPLDEAGHAHALPLSRVLRISTARLDESGSWVPNRVLAGPFE